MLFSRDFPRPHALQTRYVQSDPSTAFALKGNVAVHDLVVLVILPYPHARKFDRMIVAVGKKRNN